MWQLMAKNCKASREATHIAISKSSPDSQAIRKIMEAISEDDHPSYARYVFWGRMYVGMSMAVTMV